MPTRIADITRRATAPSPQAARGEPSLSPESLPPGTCGGCEHILFAAFEGGSMGDETLYKSPDRRAEERGAPRQARIRCRHCGRVEDRGRPAQDAVVR